MGNTFGKIFKVTTAGESYGGYFQKDKIGGLITVIEGVPAGIEISIDKINQELEKRNTNSSFITTSRKEKDEAIIFSGVMENNMTTGAPIGILVKNTDINEEQVKKHRQLKEIIRPGHANYTFYKKYGEHMDYLGGGRASGRETVSRVVAGAIAKIILDKMGIDVIAYTKESHGITASHITYEKAKENYRRNIINCPDLEKAEEMIEDLKKVKDEKNSAGGIIEIIVKGMMPGIGEPVFDKIDATIAHSLMSIGGVKGVEFGEGFELSKMLGTQSNDIPYIDGDKIAFKTNNAGGILGGISTGEEIRIRVAVKPTPTVLVMQDTVNMKTLEETKVQFSTKNDVSICPRIYPVCEAMVRIAILDAILQNKAICSIT